MTAVELLMTWICPIVAIVYVVGYSTLFEPIRKSKVPLLAKFFDCPMCIGWWAGVLVGLINWAPVEWPDIVLQPVLGGCLAITVQYTYEVFARE